MKKLILTLAGMAIILGLGIGRADADTAAFTTYPWDPNPSIPDPQWGPTNTTYRNLFWNLDGQSTAYSSYGAGDALPGNTASLNAATSILNTDALGYNAANKSGSATFTVNNNYNGTYTYFWLEMDATIKKAGSYITAALSSSSGNVTNSWGTGNTLTWNKDYDGTKINAWFRIDTVPSNETLTLTFNSANLGGKAYADNIHIATTPEPIAAALFLTGAAVLGLRKRLRRQVALA